MKDEHPIALVTGGNKGIGFSVVKQLLQAGYFVYLGARDEKRGHLAVESLKQQGFTRIAAVHLDVNDSQSVMKAAALVSEKEQHLDALINNAAIGGIQPQQASAVDIAILKEVFESNYFGAISVTQAFLPHLRKSKAPRIVNVSSELGSLGYHHRDKSAYFAMHLMAYSSSKVALNSYTLLLANELQNTNFKINSVTPGYTATDLTDHNGGQTPDEAAMVIVKYATLPESGPTGNFYAASGPLPW